MMHSHTREEQLSSYKQQARRLRDAMAGQGTKLSHSEALEMVARQHGARDWNTLVAGTRRNDVSPSALFPVGSRVSGRYLNQPFTGEVLSLAAMGSADLYKIVIHFDEPVDVVTFESFSAYRRRISALIDRNGMSKSHTSNGIPHLLLDH
jgi:hypothetical protein